MRLHVRIQRTLLRKPLLAYLTLVRPFACMRSQVYNQIFSNAERFAAYFADMRFLARVYTHVDLQVSLTRHQFPADLACNQILARVDLKVYLQGRFPVALEIANIAFVFLSFAVGLHVRVQISGARVWGVAHLAYEWLLASMSEQVSLQSLIRVEALAADLAMRHVLLVVFLFMQTKIVAGYLRDTANIAGETFVVLLQVCLQEFLRFEAFVAENALERFLLLMHLDHVLSQLLLVRETSVTFLATIHSSLLVIPLVVLPVLEELKPLTHSLVTNVAFVHDRAFSALVFLGENFIRVH